MSSQFRDPMQRNDCLRPVQHSRFNDFRRYLAEVRFTCFDRLKRRSRQNTARPTAVGLWHTRRNANMQKAHAALRCRARSKRTGQRCKAPNGCEVVEHRTRARQHALARLRRRNAFQGLVETLGDYCGRPQRPRSAGRNPNAERPRRVSLRRSAIRSHHQAAPIVIVPAIATTGQPTLVRECYRAR